MSASLGPRAREFIEATLARDFGVPKAYLMAELYPLLFDLSCLTGTSRPSTDTDTVLLSLRRKCCSCEVHVDVSLDVDMDFHPLLVASLADLDEADTSLFLPNAQQLLPSSFSSVSADTNIIAAFIAYPLPSVVSCAT